MNTFVQRFAHEHLVQRFFGSMVTHWFPHFLLTCYVQCWTFLSNVVQKLLSNPSWSSPTYILKSQQFYTNAQV